MVNLVVNLVKRNKNIQSHFTDDCGAWDSGKGSTKKTEFLVTDAGDMCFIEQRDGCYYRNRKNPTSVLVLQPSASIWSSCTEALLCHIETWQQVQKACVMVRECSWRFLTASWWLLTAFSTTRFYYGWTSEHVAKYCSGCSGLQLTFITIFPLIFSKKFSKNVGQVMVIFRYLWHLNRRSSLVTASSTGAVLWALRSTAPA